MISPAPSRALVVCIGSSVAADDAVGGAVFERLTRLGLPDDVRLKNIGVGGLRILDEIEGEPTLVVVDAVRLGGEPGTVHVVDWDDLPTAGRAVSSHGIGIREAVEIVRRLYPERVPKKVVLVGVEGEHFDRLGDMSPSVAAAVDEAARVVAELVARP